MDTEWIVFFQVVAGACWVAPMLLFLPCVVRIWRGRGDALDWIGSPVAFVGMLQVGFLVRWLLYPNAVKHMRDGELAFWAGLYALSALCAVSFVLAWRIARRLRSVTGI